MAKKAKAGDRTLVERVARDMRKEVRRKVPSGYQMAAMSAVYVHDLKKPVFELDKVQCYTPKLFMSCVGDKHLGKDTLAQIKVSFGRDLRALGDKLEGEGTEELVEMRKSGCRVAVEPRKVPDGEDEEKYEAVIEHLADLVDGKGDPVKH